MRADRSKSEGMNKYGENLIASSGKYEEERKYWIEQLKDLHPSAVLFCKDNESLTPLQKTCYSYQFSNIVSKKLTSFCNNSEYAMFIIFVSGVLYLLMEFNENPVSWIGIPQLKKDAVRDYPNRLLGVGNHMKGNSLFQEYIKEVTGSIKEAYKNQRYPLSYLYDMLGYPMADGKPIFSTVVRMEGLHERNYSDAHVDMEFAFSQREGKLLLNLFYHEDSYQDSSIRNIIKSLCLYLETILKNPKICLGDIHILSEDDKKTYQEKIHSQKQKQIEKREREIKETEENETKYLEPRNELESELVELWKEVLGKQDIGIAHNFFKLGGDSIKAVRLAALLWKYGVRVKDLYTYPTIYELSANITEVEYTVDQGPIEGEVDLTPIQKWFFKKQCQNPSHFNQSFFLYREEGMNPELVKTVFTEIMKHHDALRMRYIDEGGRLIQYNHGLDKAVVDLKIVKMTDQMDEQTFQEEVNRSQRQIDIANGPLMKLVIFQGKQGDHLLIIIHHLLVDGISWRIILEDFEKGYSQILNGSEISLPHKTHSYKEWSKRLLQYCDSMELKEEIDYWNGIVKTEVNSLIQPNKKRENQVRHRLDRQIVLSEEETEKVKNASNMLNISMESILLGSIGLAIKEWKGMGKIRVDLEGHGRQDIFDDMNINRTVGWFTAIYPCVIESMEIYIDCIKNINDMLKRVPNKGFGYGILKYLSKDSQVDFKGENHNSEICFNYLGEFDQNVGNNLFHTSHLYAGETVDENLQVDYVLDVNCIIINSKLQMNVNYNQYDFEEEGIATFKDACYKYMLEIVRYAENYKNIYKNIPRKYAIQGIIPFNEIFYKDCFYNYFFAITKYYNRPMEPVFANDIFVYQKEEEKNPFQVDTEYIVTDGLTRLIEKCGMRVKNVVVSNDIIQDVKMSVACGRTAIMRVDCYYESIRKDAYQKKHLPHMLLIYGYDDDYEQFQIIEQSDINSLDYSERTISYQEALQCYEGILENFAVGEEYPTFIEIYEEDPILPSERNEQVIRSKELFSYNMLKNKELLFSRLIRVQNFAKEFAGILKDERKLSHNIESISFSFNNMLKIKYTEAYRIAKLIDTGSELTLIMEQIIRIIKLAGNVVDKYKITKVFREKSFQKVSEELNSLYHLEHNYYNGLFALLEKE